MQKYLVILFFLPMMAEADIYRCKLPDKLIFSDIPCSYDAEKIKIKETNHSNGYINDSQLNKINITANDEEKLTNIKSVMEDVASKGRECQQDLKETDHIKRCLDYMNYVVAGSQYDKAYKNFVKLTQTKTAKNLAPHLSEINDINRNVKLVEEYTSGLRSYLKDKGL